MLCIMFLNFFMLVNHIGLLASIFYAISKKHNILVLNLHAHLIIMCIFTMMLTGRVIWMIAKSTIGFTLFLRRNLISWSAKKQPTVSWLSTETKYRAIGAATIEVTWLQSLLHELHCTTLVPPTIRCDNICATYLSANPIFHSRTKHIKVDFHFVWDKVTKKEIQVHHISIKDQIADLLTKAVSKQHHHLLWDHLSIQPIPMLKLQGVIRMYLLIRIYLFIMKIRITKTLNCVYYYLLT